MKTVILEVRDLDAIMDFAAVKRQLCALPGVRAVAMNASSSTVTVQYDEMLTSPVNLAREITISSRTTRRGLPLQPSAAGGFQRGSVPPKVSATRCG
ncbi:MAG: heavy-metal-associated domain-containing protein [Devosia sp.]